RTTGGPCSRRTGERGQAGAHREQIASEPQRRRPPGHLRPPFRSLTVRRSTHACQYGRGWPPDAAATLPRMHLALLVLRHPPLDRSRPGASALLVPRALPSDLELVGAVARLLLHQVLAEQVDVERHGGRRDVVRLLDRAASAGAQNPGRSVLVGRAELERRRACVGVLPAPRALTGN